MNRWHTHPSAHGSYVLDGTLVSPQASYPALVPRGRQDAARSLADGDGDRDRDRDGTFLFITNKPFGIQHIFGED